MARRKGGEVLDHLPVYAIDERPDKNEGRETETNCRECNEGTATIAKNIAPGDQKKRHRNLEGHVRQTHVVYLCFTFFKLAKENMLSSIG